MLEEEDVLELVEDDVLVEVEVLDDEELVLVELEVVELVLVELLVLEVVELVVELDVVQVNEGFENANVSVIMIAP